jgi:hypothetical protein
VQRQIRKIAVTLSLATTCSVVWMTIAGSGAAGAAARFRSGGVRAQLLDSATRIAPNGTAAPGHIAGSDVMAAFVGLMAVVAMLFVVVTLVRRRGTVSA